MEQTNDDILKIIYQCEESEKLLKVINLKFIHKSEQW